MHGGRLSFSRRLLILLLLLLISLYLSQGAEMEDVEPAGDEEGGGVMEAPPFLPPADPSAASDLPKLKLGETMRFEELGPIIINKDGTTKRIANWDKMTPWEHERTMARIGKRNKERIDELNAAAAAGGGRRRGGGG